MTQNTNATEDDVRLAGLQVKALEAYQHPKEG